MPRKKSSVRRANPTLLPITLSGLINSVEFDPSCEALLFTPDGTPLHAITGGANSSKDNRPGDQTDRRVEHIIPADAVKAGKYALVVEVSCNAMFGLGGGGYKYQVPDVCPKSASPSSKRL